VRLVARVDPLGGVADLEVLPADKARFFFKDWFDDLIGDARVHRRLQDDDRPGLEVLADDAGRRLDKEEVGLLGLLHRGGDADRDEVGLFDLGGVGSDVQGRLRGLGDVPRFLFDDLVADGVYLLCKCLCKGQAYIAEPDDADGLILQ